MEMEGYFLFGLQQDPIALSDERKTDMRL